MFRTQIDPASLKTKKHKQLMADLLISHGNQKIFDAGTYSVPAPTAKNPNAKREVVITKGLITYVRKKDAKQRRYAVCDAKPLGSEGSEAGVYFSQATVKLDINNSGLFSAVSKKKAADKQRFVKLNKSPEAAEHENSFLRGIALFHTKNTVVDGDRAALVTRRLKGKSLINYLIADYEKCIFTEDQRIALTIMIGEAIISQVHANGIIHRDIKADNLMVEFDKFNNPVSVTVVDYDLAKRKDAKVFEKVGTVIKAEDYKIDYRAPEVKLKENAFSNEKSDAYSFATFLDKVLWQVLFQDPKYKDLSQKHKLRILSVIQNGLAVDNNKRADIQKIVDEFKAVQAERHPMHAVPFVV